LILHSELRRRAASRRALPCPSSCSCDHSARLDLTNQSINQSINAEKNYKTSVYYGDLLAAPSTSAYSGDIPISFY